MASRRKGHGRTFEGDFLANGFRFAIVVSRFNEYITSKMLEGCENTLNRHGARPDQIDVVWVPGSFEIPTAARKIAPKKSADAIICLGCVIRGDTKHYDHVCRETAKGHRGGGPPHGRPLHLRRPDDGHDRAGDRAGGHQDGQRRPQRRDGRRWRWPA
jgi:6,7-dimethyl-8-ribityllumazine synthase